MTTETTDVATTATADATTATVADTSTAATTAAATTQANADAATTDSGTKTDATVDPGMVVPETAEGYAAFLKVPEGDDGVFAKQASAWFHEAGIPPAQAEKLATKWNEFAAAQQEAATKAEADADAQAEAKFKTEDASLRKEWGDQYDANIELGKRAFREFGFSTDVTDAIEAKVGPAQMFKIFAKIGKGLGEDTALGLGKDTGNTGRTHEHTLYPNMK